jgi:hypothetical protein
MLRKMIKILREIGAIGVVGYSWTGSPWGVCR